MSKKLEQKKRSLPDTVSPSGPAGFSSPEVTPPRVEDITSPTRIDNTEAVDMEMSDDDDRPTSAPINGSYIASLYNKLKMINLNNSTL